VGAEIRFAPREECSDSEKKASSRSQPGEDGDDLLRNRIREGLEKQKPLAQGGRGPL